MSAKRLSLFIGPAITLHRQQQQMGGPAVQKARGQGSSPSGFYRREGRIVETPWGRLCFAAPLKQPHIATVLEIEEVLGLPFGTLIATAGELAREHDEAVAKATAELRVSKEVLMERARGGEWALPTSG